MRKLLIVIFLLFSCRLSYSQNVRYVSENGDEFRINADTLYLRLDTRSAFICNLLYLGRFNQKKERSIKNTVIKDLKNIFISYTCIIIDGAPLNHIRPCQSVCAGFPFGADGLFSPI